MISIDPYLLQSLKYSNYGSVISGTETTREERAYLKEHPTLVVGYLDNYLPYSKQNAKGQAEGLVIHAVENAFEALELSEIPTFQYKAYKSYDEISLALREGEIDLAFPVTNNLWQLEQDDINASSEVVSDSGTLFYKNANQKKDIKKIAVNENNSLQIEYTQNVYPDAQLVYYSDIDQCLDAIVKGEADGTIMDTLRVQYVTTKSRYSSLTYVQLSASTGKCFGVKQGNSELLLLLNRAIKILGTSYGVDYTYQYITSFYDYGLLDLIKNHLRITLVVTFCIIAFIIIYLSKRLKRKEREIAEKESLQRQAEIANEAKSNFLFNMSHDIRTPMNAVLGFATLMEKELDQPELLQAHLKKIQLSGQYLLGLINNVLEVARIDSGKEVLDENFMNLLDERYSSMFETEVKKKQLTFTKELKVEHQYVYADAQKVREVMVNLLSNAVKYTPNGGSILMGLREEPSQRPGYATYIASVSDTGIGMTEEFQRQIFDSFSRERSSTESKIPGTGLGMSIVKKLVDLMGGRIEVESTPGKGSTFRVIVDFRLVEDPRQILDGMHKEEELEQLDLSGKRILLAEDNELNAEIAVAILGELHLQVEVAKDGVECVNMVIAREAGYYDLILMDIQMPNLNGYNATRRIRKLEDETKSQIPIVAMTANAFEEDKKDAMEAGMNGHLSKPIDVAILAKTLQEVLK